MMELMKCAVCVSYLAEVKVVLEETDVTSDSAPKITEEQKQQSISTEGAETSQKTKKKKKRKLNGTGDSTSSECLMLLWCIVIIMQINASIWHVYTYTLIGVKKVKKQDEVKETTEASAGEEQESDEKQEECAEPVKFSENGNEKEGSAEEDDSDEDGPQLPSGLTGKHGTASFVKYSPQWVTYCLV